MFGALIDLVTPRHNRQLSVPQHVDSPTAREAAKAREANAARPQLTLRTRIQGRNRFILQKLKPQTSGFGGLCHFED